MGSQLETLPGSTSSTNSPVMECSRVLEDGYILKTSLRSPEVHHGKWSGTSPSSASDVRKLGISRPHLTFKAASLPPFPAYKQFSVPLQHKMLVNSQNSEETGFYASQSMPPGDTLGKMWTGVVHSFPTLSLLVHDCIRDSLRLAHASLLGSFSELLLSECSGAGMDPRLRLKLSPNPLMHSLFLLRGYHFPVAVDCMSEPSGVVTGCPEDWSSPHPSSMSPEEVRSSADAGRSEQTSASPDVSYGLCPSLLRDNTHNSGCLEAESPRKYRKKEMKSIVGDEDDVVSCLPSGKLSDNTADVNFNVILRGSVNDVPDRRDETCDSDEVDADLVSISNADPGKMTSVGEGGTSWAWGCEDEGLADVTRDWWRKCDEIKEEVEDGDTVWEEDGDDSDGETEVDDVADELWKSFEDSALSPHLCSLMTSSRPAGHREHAQPTELCVLSTPQQLTSVQPTTARPIATTTTTSEIHVHEQATMLSDITSGLSCPAADNAYICPRTTLCPMVRQTRKRVHFPHDSKLSTVHRIVAWNFASRAARRGPWEQFARDRAHFRRRIDNVASVLEPCLAARRAAKTFDTECVTC